MGESNRTRVKNSGGRVPPPGDRRSETSAYTVVAGQTASVRGSGHSSRWADQSDEPLSCRKASQLASTGSSRTSPSTAPERTTLKCSGLLTSATRSRYGLLSERDCRYNLRTFPFVNLDEATGSVGGGGFFFWGGGVGGGGGVFCGGFFFFRRNLDQLKNASRAISLAHRAPRAFNSAVSSSWSEIILVSRRPWRFVTSSRCWCRAWYGRGLCGVVRDPTQHGRNGPVRGRKRHPSGSPRKTRDQYVLGKLALVLFNPRPRHQPKKDRPYTVDELVPAQRSRWERGKMITSSRAS